MPCGATGVQTPALAKRVSEGVAGANSVGKGVRRVWLTPMVERRSFRDQESPCDVCMLPSLASSKSGEQGAQPGILGLCLVGPCLSMRLKCGWAERIRAGFSAAWPGGWARFSFDLQISIFGALWAAAAFLFLQHCSKRICWKRFWGGG